MNLSPEQLDTPIAELQRYGLSYPLIGLLEKRCGAVYIRDIATVTDNTKWMTRGRRALIREAIHRFASGVAPCEPEQYVEPPVLAMRIREDLAELFQAIRAGVPRDNRALRIAEQMWQRVADVE